MTVVPDAPEPGVIGSKKRPGIEQRLHELVEPETGGDPEAHVKITRSSLRNIVGRLKECSPHTVRRLLRNMDYSLRTNVKRLTEEPHPHRDRQYRFIQHVKAVFLTALLPERERS